MSEITKKNGGAVAEWNPMRAMQEMLRWDPFREMLPMFPTTFEGVEWNPKFDVTETKESFVFKADVPGVNKEDLQISTTGNRIQISGKRESEHETKTDTVYTIERQCGSFTRSFTLPNGADIAHAKSDLANGVLTLVVPKVAEAQSKNIPISTAATKS